MSQNLDGERAILCVTVHKAHASIDDQAVPLFQAGLEGLDVPRTHSHRRRAWYRVAAQGSFIPLSLIVLFVVCSPAIL